jgi:hypothetical protein
MLAMMGVLRGLAANVGLDLGLLLPLLATTDRPVLVALAGRADLTGAAATTLARHADVAVRESLAGNPGVARWTWPALVVDPSARVRRALATGQSQDFRPAADPPLPEPAQWALARDPEVDVRRALSHRHGLATRVGLRLAADPSVLVRRAVALRWRPVPEAAVRSLLRDPDAQVRRNILLTGTPPPDLRARLLADPETRREAARGARLDPDDVAALVADADPAVREGVAGNPWVPLAQVLPLAQDPDEEVRAAVMLRPDLPGDVRERIASTVEPHDYHVAAWLTPDRATLAQRLAQVESRFIFFRRAVAYSPDLPATAVTRLAGDEDHSVRLLLAENHPDAPAGILPDLVARAGHAAWELVKHRNMPAHALAEFARSDDELLRRVAATGPNLPTAAAIALAGHADHVTRQLVAANPALPLPEVVRMLDHPWLAEAAARNPRLPPALARELLAGTAPLRLP